MAIDALACLFVCPRGPMLRFVAGDDVRTIRIGRRQFESMVRERPDVSLAMMRVLAERLDAVTRERASPAPEPPPGARER